MNNSPTTPSSLASTSGNGAITYSVVSAGATGCSVASVTGVISISASGNCTIRATASATSTYLAGRIDVTFVVTAPTTTTTTIAPTTTTTTVVTATTPVPPTTTTTTTTTTVAVSEAPVVTVPQGQASVATIVPSVGSITTVLAQMQAQTPRTTRTTTTTIPPVITTVANAPSAVAPTAPALAPGEVGAVVNGQKTAATLSRADNQITATAGDITTTLSGLTSGGQRVALNPDGNLVVNEGVKLVVGAAGYAPGADVAVWLYSTPTRLGVIAADADGQVAGSFDLPSGLEVGDHRLVLSGENPAGANVLVVLGLSYGIVESGSSITRVLIAIPIALAILFGLFLPAATRRRRQNTAIA